MIGGQFWFPAIKSLLPMLSITNAGFKKKWYWSAWREEQLKYPYIKTHFSGGANELYASMASYALEAFEIRIV
jgi:hypothetical protein